MEEDLSHPPQGTDTTPTQMHNAFGALSYYVATIVLVIGGVLFFGNQSVDATPASILQPPARETTAFDTVTLEAYAAFVYDAAEDKILFEKNADEKLPLASLTKIMTALVATEQHKADTLVPISEQALKPEGDQGLLVGDHFELSALAALTLVSSSNDGAEALSELSNRTDFIGRMNSRARELGLSKTYFFNPTGLDVSERVSGGYGSAEDVAHLLLAAVSSAPQVFSYTTHESYGVYSNYLGNYDVENTNERAQELSGLIASKTGFTDLAGGNLAILFDAGLARPIAVVVLGSSIEGRFDDAYALAQATREELRKPHYYGSR